MRLHLHAKEETGKARKWVSFLSPRISVDALFTCCFSLFLSYSSIYPMEIKSKKAELMNASRGVM